MHISKEQIDRLNSCAEAYPYSIAKACRYYLNEMPEDPWRAWELLSRGILQPVLNFMSHLLLSDLIAIGEKPPQLFHHIQAILSRPMAGQYVGFLRETARHYHADHLDSSVPELVQFLIESEINCTKLDNGRALIALLVEYRNAFAHGRVLNNSYAEETATTVFELTIRLLEEIEFLSAYPLLMEDGSLLMGHSPKGLALKTQALSVLTARQVSMRPLLLKLEKGDLVLLEDADIAKPALTFRGTSTYHRFTKKQLEKGDPALILEALKESLARVRSMDAVLARPNWDDFYERADLLTQRTYDDYVTGYKYDSEIFVPRPDWEGEQGLLSRFLVSDKTLFAVSGGQGTGKSALAAHLAAQCRDAGHAVLFMNAQRLTYADVTWSENPVPIFLQNVLNYEFGMDYKGMQRLAKQVPEDKKIVVFF